MPKRKCSNIVLSLGQNLIYYRKKCGLTQQQVADMLNLNRSTYTKYETSVSEPSLEILLKIANIFGVEPNDLLLRDEAIEIVCVAGGDEGFLSKKKILNI